MIRTLSALKYLKAGFAVFTGIFLFICLYQLIGFLLTKISFGSKKPDAFEDIPTIYEMNRMSEAVKIYEKELSGRTTVYTAWAVFFALLLLSGAVFHTRIIDRLGVELYSGCSILLLTLSLLCILRKYTYRENSCMYLCEYIEALCRIYPDFHECIRLLLSPHYTNVVFGNVLAAIYRSVQEISDIDMLSAAGRIMNFEMLSDMAYKIKQKMNGERFLSAYYSEAFREVKEAKKHDTLRSIRGANVIGIAVSFVCLFSLCLVL